MKITGLRKVPLVQTMYLTKVGWIRGPEKRMYLAYSRLGHSFVDHITISLSIEDDFYWTVVVTRKMVTLLLVKGVPSSSSTLPAPRLLRFCHFRHPTQPVPPVIGPRT